MAVAGVVTLVPQDLRDPSAALERALKDFEEKRFSSAIEVFKKEAEAGDANAQYAYAVCLENGIGVPRDFAAAEKLLRQAAEQGHRAAQKALGMMLTMRGLPEDVHAEGIRWLEKALAAGDSSAALELGDFYVTRFNPAPEAKQADVRKARELYEKALAAGSAEAKFRLGLIIEEGKDGSQPDVERGVKLIEEAAAEGSVEAMVGLAKQYHLGNFVKQDFEKAREYYEKAVKAGRHPDAQFSLGKLYEEGLGVPQDLERAVFYFRQSAEQKFAPALVQLGHCHDAGRGVERDEEAALRYFKEAALHGSGAGMLQVAVYHEQGKGGLTADPVESARWLIRAAEAGHALAMNELALRYKDGNGVLKDLTAAAAWLDKAVALHALPAAQVNLGSMFEMGMGVPQSYQRAGELYTLAAMAGRPDAKHLLARLFLNGLGIAPDPARAYVLITEAANMGYPASIEAKEKMEQQLKPEDLAKARELLNRPASAPESTADSAAAETPPPSAPAPPPAKVKKPAAR